MRQAYYFKNGNFDDLRESLSQVPFDIAYSDDTDEHWLYWKNLFSTAVKEHIPTNNFMKPNLHLG